MMDMLSRGELGVSVSWLPTIDLAGDDAPVFLET